MTDFTPPFALDADDKRVPTANERELGFACGPANMALFNGLFFLLEGNVKHVADQAGEVPAQDFDLTLLYRSIQALIDSATGDNPAGYVLMNQARARLPIFPEILNTDGRIVITSPGTGQIRIPGGVDFMHRGIFTLTTVQTDINTDPSKTYHVRWNPTDGFTLKDLTGGGAYNPSSLVETNSIFDSTYDDMLVARIITNSGNVPSITNLSNKHRLWIEFVKNTFEQQAVTWSGLPYLNGSQNWARTPTMKSVPQMSTEATLHGESIVAVDMTVTRYQLIGMVRGYVFQTGYATPYLSGQMTVNLAA